MINMVADQCVQILQIYDPHGGISGTHGGGSGIRFFEF